MGSVPEFRAVIHPIGCSAQTGAFRACGILQALGRTASAKLEGRLMICRESAAPRHSGFPPTTIENIQPPVQRDALKQYPGQRH